ncbi:MAG: TIR domain-containing protein [Candidatus Lokiarchaeota archaeon]|nr:TIR domain-containing protein [Candidatus Lokiarchaeota archaeon]
MKIYISYAPQDSSELKLLELVGFLENEDRIDRVYYWERDTKEEQEFEEYMEDGVNACDIILVFCTGESKKTESLQKEINIAKQNKKRIIPIFTRFENIAKSIRDNRGLKFDRKSFKDLRGFYKFCGEIYYLMTEENASYIKKWHFYISHSWKEMHTQVVNDLVDLLKSKGYYVWYDKLEWSNKLGDWKTVVVREIRGSVNFLPVLCYEYFNSQAYYELKKALKFKDAVNIIPIRLKSIDEDFLKSQELGEEIINLTTIPWKIYEGDVESLLEHIMAVIEQQYNKYLFTKH